MQALKGRVTGLPAQSLPAELSAPKICKENTRNHTFPTARARILRHGPLASPAGTRGEPAHSAMQGFKHIWDSRYGLEAERKEFLLPIA